MLFIGTTCTGDRTREDLLRAYVTFQKVVRKYYLAKCFTNGPHYIARQRYDVHFFSLLLLCKQNILVSTLYEEIRTA